MRSTLPLDHPTIAFRHTLLMCAPDFYTVEYVINPWMAGNVHLASITRAQAQWTALHATLSGLADVHLVRGQPGSPDMVFTANAGLARDRTVALSSFHHPERQGEEPHFRRWFDAHGYEVIDLPRALSFEGEGDALFSTDGNTLFIGDGPRTGTASHDVLRALWPEVGVVALTLVDPRFYHLDTCFAPLFNGDLLYFPAAFDEASQAVIERHYDASQRIAVSEADAACFACNAVNLDRTVVLNRISAELEATLATRGFEVIQLPLDEFLKAGGAAKCLVMKLTPELHASEARQPATSLSAGAFTAAASHAVEEVRL